MVNVLQLSRTVKIEQMDPDWKLNEKSSDKTREIIFKIRDFMFLIHATVRRNRKIIDVCIPEVLLCQKSLLSTCYHVCVLRDQFR